MENYTFLKEKLVSLLFLFSIGAFSQTVTIASYDFSSDEQGWTVGSDAGRATGTQWSCDGNAGHLYVADTGNGRIRKIDAHGTITTVAGDGNLDDSHNALRIDYLQFH